MAHAPRCFVSDINLALKDMNMTKVQKHLPSIPAIESGITRRAVTVAIATFSGAVGVSSANALNTVSPVQSNPIQNGLAKPSDRSGASYLDRVRNAKIMEASDFGAQGDGFEHPLSEFYNTLEAAQVEFPQATSLNNLIDGLAIQKALRVIKTSHHERGRLYIRTGRYRGNTGSIRLPNFVEMVGEGPGITVIDNQNTRVGYPLIVNDNPAGFINSALLELSLHGGYRAIDVNVSSEIAGITFDGVSMALQTMGNMRCNKLLQLSLFNNTTFGDAPWGLEVPAFTTNAVDFRTVSFENHTVCSLRLRSAEAVNISGGRFEGGGRPPARVVGSIAGNLLTVTAAMSATLQVGDELIALGIAPETRVVALRSGTGGIGTYVVSSAQSLGSRVITTFKASIDIDNAKAFNIDGVYFEATHKKLLQESNCRNGITFKGCHFTGAKEGKSEFEEYQFKSDGLVTFERNNFGLPTVGPSKMLVIGQNKNLGFNSDVILAVTERGGKLITKRRNFTDAISFEALKFSRLTDVGSQSVTGILRITMNKQSATGGVGRVCVEEYGITVSAAPGNAMQIQASPARVIDQNASGFEMSIANVRPTSLQALLQIECKSGSTSDPSYLFASFDYELGHGAPDNQISVDFV